MTVFDRFTDRARKVMALANQHAQRYNNEFIGTEHILIGLLKVGSGTSDAVLKNLDVDIKELVRSGPDMGPMGKLPQTPKAKKVIEYAIEEAKSLSHKYVGTEHILLGLLRETEGIPAQLFMRIGLRHEEVRREVMDFLGIGIDKSIKVTSYKSIEPLTIMIDPGDASAEELSELFVELSFLYRMIGGSGVNFTIVGAKEIIPA